MLLKTNLMHPMQTFRDLAVPAVDRLRAMAFVAGVLTCAIACATSSSSQVASTAAGATANAVSSGVPNLFDAQRLVEQYVLGGRYEADVANVVAGARAWLEARSRTAAKPAIVLDVDETSLSNWPAYRVNSWARITSGECDLQLGPCGLRAWQAMARSKAIAPTLALARRARELNVAVFFITGRPANLQAATERNLRDEGFEWTGVILEPPGGSFASAADFKAPERQKLADQGYTIILSLGDQQSDLTGGNAERTFKLPNPVYFIP
jgi:acid phosphatase